LPRPADAGRGFFCAAQQLKDHKNNDTNGEKSLKKRIISIAPAPVHLVETQLS
jgi:hypothetical protein